MNVIHGAMAYTAQLDITYVAPTPVGEPILARAWLADRTTASSSSKRRCTRTTSWSRAPRASSSPIDRSAFLEHMLAAEE